MRRVRDILAIVVLVTVTSGAPAVAQTAPPTPTPLPGGAPGVTSVAAILVNITDGDHILFTRSGTAQRAPASLTKVMTALVARDEYELDEIVTADPIVLNTHGSDLGLEP